MLRIFILLKGNKLSTFPNVQHYSKYLGNTRHNKQHCNSEMKLKNIKLYKISFSITKTHYNSLLIPRGIYILQGGGERAFTRNLFVQTSYHDSAYFFQGSRRQKKSNL